MWVVFEGLPREFFPLCLPHDKTQHPYAKEPIMATLTISLSDEEMLRLEALGKREGRLLGLPKRPD